MQPFLGAKARTHSSKSLPRFSITEGGVQAIWQFQRWCRWLKMTQGWPSSGKWVNWTKATTSDSCHTPSKSLTCQAWRPTGPTRMRRWPLRWSTSTLWRKTISVPLSSNKTKASSEASSRLRKGRPNWQTRKPMRTMLFSRSMSSSWRRSKSCRSRFANWRKKTMRWSRSTSSCWKSRTRPKSKQQWLIQRATSLRKSQRKLSPTRTSRLNCFQTCWSRRAANWGKRVKKRTNARSSLVRRRSRCRTTPSRTRSWRSRSTSCRN